MNVEFIAQAAREMKLDESQVLAAANLLSDGATVPFVARYRKEATGSLGENALMEIRNRVEKREELDKRRDAILKFLEERKLLDEELGARIAAAQTLIALEDVFLPYRPKRRTRAMLAREKGLEPLAHLLLEQQTGAVADEAQAYVNVKKGLTDAGEALQGARDILAETISEDADVRARLRELFFNEGVLESKLVKNKAAEGAKYKDYFNWREPAAAAPSHRVLAMFRGEKEGFLALRIAPPEEAALALVSGKFIRGNGPASDQVALAVQDSYKRLLGPAMEEEYRNELKTRADAEAIRVFGENLRELLMAPPLGRKNVLALATGFQGGCKLACLDKKGEVLHEDTIQIQIGSMLGQETATRVLAYCARFQVEAIAVGNGAGGRDAEAFVRSIGLPPAIAIVTVDETAAAVYGAAEAGEEEFPGKDPGLRAAISLGRRLQNPLAELIKLDLKSIGVGQYQQDVDAAALKRALDDVAVSCVNAVGVSLNSASKQTLAYVSGLGANLAANIAAYRTENGPFANRALLRKVNRLGAKAFEQSAGFLRIAGGENPLDATAIHPESYGVVEKMAADLRCAPGDLMRDESLRRRIELDGYATKKIGLPTLRDILDELAKPGRDPRPRFETFSFAENVNAMEDLKPGMRLPGIITNVTAFGAFVDIGVHQDGLIHISQLADRFVRDPNEVVKIHQAVVVTVMDIDISRKRISLSMRTNPMQPADGRAAAAGSGAPGDRKSASAPAPDARRAGPPERGGAFPPPPPPVRSAGSDSAHHPAERDAHAPSATPRLFGPPPSEEAAEMDEPEEELFVDDEEEQLPPPPPKPKLDLSRYLEQVAPRPAPQTGPRKTPKCAAPPAPLAPRKELSSEEVRDILIAKFRSK